MSVENLIEKLSERLGGAGFGHTVNLNMGDDGIVHVDGTQNPPIITQGEAEAEGTINISLENLFKLAEGTLNPMGAFMNGTLSIDGSMGAVMALQSALD